jgi:hypothetical protein
MMFLATQYASLSFDGGRIGRHGLPNAVYSHPNNGNNLQADLGQFESISGSLVIEVVSVNALFSPPVRVGVKCWL